MKHNPDSEQTNIPGHHHSGSPVPWAAARVPEAPPWGPHQPTATGSPSLRVSTCSHSNSGYTCSSKEGAGKEGGGWDGQQLCGGQGEESEEKQAPACVLGRKWQQDVLGHICPWEEVAQRASGETSSDISSRASLCSAKSGCGISMGTNTVLILKPFLMKDDPWLMWSSSICLWKFSENKAGGQENLVTLVLPVSGLILSTHQITRSLWQELTQTNFQQTES